MNSLELFRDFIKKNYFEYPAYLQIEKDLKAFEIINNELLLRVEERNNKYFLTIDTKDYGRVWQDISKEQFDLLKERLK